MPGIDNTGPQGAGPGTGRGMGNCGQARGLGLRKPRGRCFNHGMRMGMQFESREDKLKFLENEEKMLNK